MGSRLFTKIAWGVLLSALCSGAALASAYSSAVMALSPVAYYRLDDAGTPIADSSGNGHTLTVFNGAWLYHQPSLLLSDPNYAVKAVPNAYGSTSGSGTVPFSYTNTIVAWFTLPSVTTTSYIPIATYGPDTLAECGGSVGWNWYGNSTCTKAIPVGANTTYFCALTGVYGAPNVHWPVSIACNGANYVSANVPGYGSFTSQSGNVLYVGLGCYTPTYCSMYGNGVIDDVAVFNYQLSQAQVNTLYCTGTGTCIPGTPASFMGVWR